MVGNRKGIGALARRFTVIHSSGVSRLRFRILLALTACLSLSGASSTTLVAQGPPVPPPVKASALSGWLTLLWVDPPPGMPEQPGPITRLTDDQGRTYRLTLPEELAQKLGGIQSLDRHRVTLDGNWLDARHEGLLVSSLRAPRMPARSDEISAAESPEAVVKPYAVILCRFSDTTGFTPHPPSYYAGLFGDAAPGASHFWQEASYNAISLNGCALFGWYNLPRPRAYYLNTAGTRMDVDRLFADATAVADADVNYNAFAGIQILVNDALNNVSALGGAAVGTLDGSYRAWPATWLPLWAHLPVYLNHETGHSLGLPHSSGPYQDTYDSAWDVMSYGGNWVTPDPTYGPTPVHTIAWHEARLGFLPAKRIYLAQPGSSQTIPLGRLAQPASSDDYLMAQIFIGGWATRFYTVELRQDAGYDAVGGRDTFPYAGLPAAGVVIHRVDTTLADRNAQVVDGDGNGNPNDAGAVWTPGETFRDGPNGITIAVGNATSTGISVTISLSSDVPFPSVVSNSGDQGPGSLRNAIFFANQLPGSTIRLGIAPSDPAFANGVFTLQPTVPLPTIAAAGTVIDGGTQRSRTGDTNAGRPAVVLNGARAGAGADGLDITGAGCLVRGLTINGFGDTGIALYNPGAIGNTVQGCYIGLNATGTVAVPNGRTGIQVLWGARDNVIGGTTPELRNVIAGNKAYGIEIYGAGTEGTRVLGNFLGTDATGLLPIPNTANGIQLYGGAARNTIGGTAAGAGNHIAFNGGDGIRIADAGSVGNTLRGNVLFGNSGLGINLVGGSQDSFGVTANDAGDADTGPNNLQNAPVIADVVVSSDGTTVLGSLNSTPGASFALDFYASPDAHRSGYGEGARYLGSTTATADTSGNASFVLRLAGALPNPFVTVTATNTATGDTSEFSLAKKGF